MTQRDPAQSASLPPIVQRWPRAGHWRREPRNRLGEAMNKARAVIDSDARQAAAVAQLPMTEQRPIESVFTSPTPTRTATVAAPVSRPGDLVVDLRPALAEAVPAVRPATQPDWGLGRHWGSTWRWTAQGWVDRETDNPTWRPVVTTTDDLSNWEPDTYLGVVSGEVAVIAVRDPATLGAALADGREAAMRSMVDAAVARGAHAVIGSDLVYTELGAHILVTSTGTAVTLRER